MFSHDLVKFPMPFLAAAVLCAAPPAHAYIGPGAGLGARLRLAWVSFFCSSVLFGIR